MNCLEDRLRDAFGAAAQTVRPDSVRALRARPHPGRRRRLAPLAAAAAVAAIVVAASVSTPLLLTGRNHARPSSTGSGPSAPTASAGPSGALGLTQLITSSAYAVTLAIPLGWRQVSSPGSVIGYRGADGWVELRSAAYQAGLQTACSSIAAGNGEPLGIYVLRMRKYHAVAHPYGSHPWIDYRSIDGRPGCLVVPSGDAPTVFPLVGGAALAMTSALVEYRSPLPGGANFLVISADPPHLTDIIDSIQLHH